MIWPFLTSYLRTLFYLSLLVIVLAVPTFIVGIMTGKVVQTINFEQCNIHDKINSFCSDVSIRCRELSSESPRTAFDVTVSIHWNIEGDTHGKYSVMDHINVTIGTTNGHSDTRSPPESSK